MASSPNPSLLSSLTTYLLEVSFSLSFLASRFRQLREALKERHSLQLFVLLLVLDFGLGLIVSHYVPPKSIVSSALEWMDVVVFNLRRLITWLMGAPAGLKLNSVLSNALGRFFLYHIHLWVTFLYVSEPFVSAGLSQCMAVLSYLGLCLQISVAQDAFNLATFHVHCFYAYARSLFRTQTSGLKSLWRLFLGKKYNPLRKRVDTSVNNVDQLFVGTVAFTILLFLYPTTLMYYAVFKILEMALAVVNFGLSFAVKTVSTFTVRKEEELIFKTKAAVI